MDFTIKKYNELIESIYRAGYNFQTFAQFIEGPAKKVVILRHDVDKLPRNSLQLALIQHKLGIQGSYYFRTVSQSYDKDVIMRIQSMGHEIGYHYETMDSCNGDVCLAYDEFCKNLDLIRKVVPVKTVCMHGSPMSKFDNRAIWKKFDYRKLGIIAEPYFDVDFNRVFYLTDTGRRFDGDKVSIRDKPTQKVDRQWPSYKTTNDIIEAIKTGSFPDVAMITIHPQRWSDSLILWTKEWVWQNSKNSIKRIIVKRRK